MPEISRDVFSKIRKIQIHTSQLADDIMAGAWHSAFKGQGMEFEEVREYQPGDDIRIIDWKVTARMKNTFVKVFREERELTVFLIVDVSASSRYGSSNQLKKDLVAEIGAVLAFSAIKNNDKIGLVLFSQHVEKYIPPKRGLRHVLRVIRELLAYRPNETGTDLAEPLRYFGSIQRRSSICFVISDFICPLPEQEMSLLANRHDLIAVAVSDPTEFAPPRMELVTAIDLETGEAGVLDSESTRARMAMECSAMQRQSRIEELMKKLGSGFIAVQTNQPYLPSMKKFFKLRGRRR